MIKFNDCTYLSQVRRLRLLAIKVLNEYKIGAYKLEFINHGENTTYKVTTKKRKYLLRIHRDGYHTEKAILEELRWLKKLSEETNISIQKPVTNKKGKLLTPCHISEVETSRFCDLLLWQEGYIKYKKNNQNYFDVGVLTATLHKNPIPVKHRHYWDTQGLIGTKSMFGSLKDIQKDFPKAYEKLEPYRKLVERKLKAYEKKNSSKYSMIHADLHFGNMLWGREGIKPIDFDDCGYGPHMYDIAVTFYSSWNHFNSIGKKESARTKQSFFDGYNSVSHLTQADLNILPYMVMAREIAMVCWLNGRRDNSRLYEYLKESLTDKIKRVQSYHREIK